MESSARFYSDLPTRSEGLGALLADPSAFHPAPDDWEVLVTDVRGSSKAVGEGRQQVVNLVAAGSIIAALNLAHRVGLDLPFFFGGDGATLMAPPALAPALAGALGLHRENARTSFDLDLRVGRVPVARLREQGLQIDLAKVDVNRAGLVLSVALGDGLQVAEDLVKRGPDPAREGSEADLDLAGMECRWDSIRPPEGRHEVVCLVVAAREPCRQAPLFAEVLRALDDHYGPLASRSPISRPRLRLKTGPGGLAAETRARLGRFDLGYLLGTWFTTQVIGRPWFAWTRAGHRYLERLVDLSDTLMIDGRLHTVISGTAGQRQGLEGALGRLEDRGDLHYGLEVCPASVVSCYVRDRQDQHIHFVDGEAGGYTRAAARLKAKRAAGG